MALRRVPSEQSLKLSSTVTSDTSNDTVERHPSIETRVCLVGGACNDEKLKNNLKELHLPYVTSQDGKEYFDDEDQYHETVFVLEDFDGDLFEDLKQTDIRILGTPVIASLAETNKPLPYNTRPLYNTCMQGLNLCFTNFKTKEHLVQLVNLCHYMGACIRKEMTSKIDFLVTNSLHGPKYRTAVSLGTPVMKEEWVHRCWAARRREKLFRATDDEFLAPCKSKPFEGCILSFLGFSENEKKHMQEQAIQQGGSITEVGDSSCTHLVVDEHTVKSLPFEPEGRIYIVVQEWFWGSIQIEAKAAESMYIFELVDYPKGLARSATTSSLLGTPKWRGAGSTMMTRQRASAGKMSFSRKRSRLREETLAKLAQESDADSSRPPLKRTSTDTSACLPDSMLDMSNSTTGVKSPKPTELFLRRRSARLKNKQKLRCSTSRYSSHSCVREDGIFHFPDSQERSGRFLTYPALVSQWRELSQEGLLPADEEESVSKADFALKRSKTTEPVNSVTEQQGKANRKRKKGVNRRSKGWQNAETYFENELSSIVSSPPSKKKSQVSKVVEGQSQKLEIKHKRRLSLAADVFRKTPLPRPPRAIRRLSMRTRSRNKLLSETLLEEADCGLDDTVVAESGNTTLVDNDSIPDSDDEIPDEDILQERNYKVSSPKPIVSARYQVVMEFLQTEKNYVSILQTIINLFKKPLEDTNQPGGQILAIEDVKAIFGSLPEIAAVHQSMRDDLEDTVKAWDDASCVGKLVYKYAGELGRCYPPFVNFFEVSVETINRCDAKSPRFHAFLKINQAKKECGRQTLAELLINPVQRIPRIILLLQDIKKHTVDKDASHPDIKEIESSTEALKEVMTHINEDKRKTESQLQIFEVVYEVENCPPTLVSSHRKYVGRAEMIAIDDNLCRRGDHISIFVFSDCIEVTKRRRGVKGGSFKSPNVHSVHTRPPSSAKPLKHIKLMSLLHIKRVVDINNSEDCQNALSLFCRTPTDKQDWLYTFKILSCSDDTTSLESNANENKENTANVDSPKQRLMRMLAKHRANTMYKASDENFVCVVNAHELEISTSDLGSTLGRAVRAAKKSSRKLTRAFSFRGTPKRSGQKAESGTSSPSQKSTASSLSRADSITSKDIDTDDSISLTSGLTPSMSVTSLLTPQMKRRAEQFPSSSSLQIDNEDITEEHCHQPTTPKLKSSVSTLHLARPRTAADMIDFPAVPTPPARKKKVGSTLKAATIAFGRSGSFRLRRKYESAV